MANCSSCNAPIIWAITERSLEVGTVVRIPIDAEPVDDGNIHLYDGVAYVLSPTGQAIVEHRMSGGLLYRTHFSTCPNAGQHRKRNR